jgi:hypothetical protein
MIKATLETSNFTFEAYGQTTAHAVNALTRGLEAHAKQYSLAPAWYDRANIQIQYLDACKCYRDGELIK